MTHKAQGYGMVDLIFVCGIIGLLCMIALPNLMAAKSTAGAASAIGSLRTITSSELTYALTCGNGFYAPNLSTLGTAPGGSLEAFIGGGLGTADIVVKSNYQIQIQGAPFAGAPATCNGLGAGEAAQGYKAVADPVGLGNPRFFGTNANAMLYEHTSTLLVGMPESGEPALGHPIR